MKYDYFAMAKSRRFDRVSYNKFKNDHNLYFLHGKIDATWNNKPGDNKSLLFSYKGAVYNLCPTKRWEKGLNDFKNFLRYFNYTLTLTANFYTASENKFYSIANPLAKERPTGLPLIRGSSLKGALRLAAIDIVEGKLMDKYFENYLNLPEDQIIQEESANKNDRFFFKERSQLVKLFGNENERKINWFTFKTLLATGGIKDVKKVKEIIEKISDAFDRYLKKNKIVNSEGVCRGRLIFSDIYFTKIGLDVITPLKRDTRTPVPGPIYYEVVPAGESTNGTILWFPFDLIAKGEIDEMEKEWENDEKIIKKAFEKLQEKGIGAKTKDGWGRFDIGWEEE